MSAAQGADQQAGLNWYEVPTGLVAITGPDRIDILHRLCSQDVRQLAGGCRETHALMVSHQGRLLDWVRLFSVADTLYVMTSVGRAQTLVTWLDGFTIMEEVTYRVVGEAMPAYAVLGSGTVSDASAAAQLAQACAAVGLERAPAQGCVVPTGDDLHPCAALRVHHALGGGIMLVPLGTPSPSLATELSQALGPQGPAAGWETRRLYAGLPASEFEYKGPAAPFELRMTADSIHWHKGCYIGQEVLSRLEAYDKVARLLMGVQSTHGAAELERDAAGARIYVDGQNVGRITSWQRLADGDAHAPADAFIGLAVVKRQAAAAQAMQLMWPAAEGSQPTVVAAQLCDRPLWQPRTAD